MQRRGTELGEHILWTAKDLFLEEGFERASMDVVAARAQTSKRTLYAHFGSKEKLFLAVIDLVRDLYLTRLQTPADHSDDPVEAITRFCGVFQAVLVTAPSLRTLRLGIAEADRLPEAAARHHETIFATTQDRLIAYLNDDVGFEPAAATDAAVELLGRALYPRVIGALLGVEPTHEELPDDDVIAADPGLEPLRATVVELLATRSPRGSVRAGAPGAGRRSRS